MRRSSAPTSAAERAGGAPGRDAIPELVPIGRPLGRDLTLLAVALIFLAMFVVKPWGEPAPPVLPTLPAAIGGTAAATAGGAPTAAPASTASLAPTPTPLPPPLLTDLAFGPAPTACLDSARWLVCVLDADGALEVRSMFSPRRRPAVGPGAPPTRSNPAVLILTARGAGLGFYAPVETERLVDGRVAVTAWRVADESLATRWLPLEEAGTMTLGERVVANVYLPAEGVLTVAEHWPAGRYIVRLQAANGDHWDRFFALLVLDGASEVPSG